MITNARKFLMDKYDHLYQIFVTHKDNRYVCFYCGLPAPTLDHVPSLNCIEDLRMVHNEEDINYLKVPACSECNSMAGDIPHLDIWERRDFLKERIRQKYKKDINFRDWYDDELDTLADNLKREVVGRLKLKYEVISRLLFGENTNFYIADLGYMNFDPELLKKYGDTETWKQIIRVVYDEKIASKNIGNIK